MGGTLRHSGEISTYCQLSRKCSNSKFDFQLKSEFCEDKLYFVCGGRFEELNIFYILGTFVGIMLRLFQDEDRPCFSHESGRALDTLCKADRLLRPFDYFPNHIVTLGSRARVSLVSPLFSSSGKED